MDKKDKLEVPVHFALVKRKPYTKKEASEKEKKYGRHFFYKRIIKL